uniref:Choline transporter-like protein n=1 Tax=Palpitomonas bilix TaxID=652834 RepID=A0A7S3LVV3_9EUKA|mmetsp:Transcript_50470/g.130060  ORF Transcript_50470/g.130060 Transcript_50470/m.130060 type:complete len:753 (+) Transcript_50470:118-2376(+)
MGNSSGKGESPPAIPQQPVVENEEKEMEDLPTRSRAKTLQKAQSVRRHRAEELANEEEQYRMRKIRAEVEQTIERVGDSKAYFALLQDRAFTYEKEQKKCRDVFCLVIFIAFWLAAIGVALFGIIFGDPWRIINGYDYTGLTCGRGNNTGLDYMYYPSITSEFLSDYSSAICVSECPSSVVLPMVCRRGYNVTDSSPNYLPVLKVAQEFASDSLRWIVKHNLGENATSAEMQCSWPDTAVGTCPSKQCSAAAGRVMPPCFLAYPSSGAFGRCVPIPNSGGSTTTPTGNGTSSSLSSLYNDFKEILLNPAQLLNRIVEAAMKEWFVLAITIGSAVLLSFLWLILLKLIGPIIVVFTIVLIIATCIVTVVLLWIKAGYIDSTFLAPLESMLSLPFSITATFEDETMGLVIAIIGTVICSIVFLIVVAIIPRIGFALKVTRAAGNVILDVKSIILFPIVPVLLEALAIAYFVLIGAYLATGGDFNCRTGRYEWTMALRGFLILHLFASLWALFFTEAWEQLIYAGVGARWYFKTGKLSKPIYKSWRAASAYHTGSLALGSFLVTTLTMIRLAVNYYLKKARKFKDHFFLKFLTVCLNCCLKCFDRVLRFLNKSAYIQIALHGKNFCTSAKNSAMLLLRNILRVAAVNVLTEIFVLLGKVYVALSCVVIAAGVSVIQSCDCASSIVDSVTSNVTVLVCAVQCCGTHSKWGRGQARARVFSRFHSCAHIDTKMGKMCVWLTRCHNHTLLLHLSTSSR